MRSFIGQTINATCRFVACRHRCWFMSRARTFCCRLLLAYSRCFSLVAVGCVSPRWWWPMMFHFCICYHEQHSQLIGIAATFFILVYRRKHQRWVKNPGLEVSHGSWRRFSRCNGTSHLHEEKNRNRKCVADNEREDEEEDAENRCAYFCCVYR